MFVKCPKERKFPAELLKSMDNLSDVTEWAVFGL